MNKTEHRMDATVSFGEKHLVIRRKGSSTPETAGILAIEHDQHGQTARIYLDRLVHHVHHTHIGEWRVRGAVSSILEAEGCGDSLSASAASVN